MNVRTTASTERIGVSFVQLAFERLRYIFREQSISDYGIDAHVEVVEEGKATGRLIALQIKSGKSWFREKGKEGFIFREDIAHLDYWLNHSLPVLIVIFDPDGDAAYWQVVNSDNAIATSKGCKIEIPFHQKIDAQCKESIGEIAKKPASEANKYNFLSLRDVSHGAAKRYAANLLVSESCSTVQIHQIIREVTEALKQREYYRDEIVKQRWKGYPAQVVFLYIYKNLDDFRTNSWICTSLWIDKNLSSQFAPMRLRGEEIGDDVVVSWSSHYKLMQVFRHQSSLNKENYLAQFEALIEPIRINVGQAIAFFDDYKSGLLDRQTYKQNMVELESIVTRLYMQAGEIGLAPLECKDMSLRFQSLMAYAHNIVLPFSENGLKTWDENTRDYLVNSAIKSYQKDYVRLEFELEKAR